MMTPQPTPAEVRDEDRVRAEELLNEFTITSQAGRDDSMLSPADSEGVINLVASLLAAKREAREAFTALLKWETQPEVRAGKRLHQRLADVQRARAALSRLVAREGE